MACLEIAFREEISYAAEESIDYMETRMAMGIPYHDVSTLECVSNV